MAVTNTMASQFSEDYKYFAYLSTEGKLKIWDTLTNSLDQEFTPEFHLTAPCKCLQFINPATTRKEGSPRKKKKRDSQEIPTPQIALGSSSGKLLLYSVAKAELESNIDSSTSQPINCLSWSEGNILYSGIEQNVVCWDLNRHCVKSKWKAGNEQITCILSIPGSTKLLTASRSIKLWSAESKQLLHTYTGHSHDVVLLRFVSPRNYSESYFISASKGERLLSCWSLREASKEKNSLVSFLMDDAAQDVSIGLGADGSTYMAAVTRSGVTHVFRHTLNGKSNKPLKPKQTIQVATDTEENTSSVTPIPILCAIFKENLTLLIGHGNQFILTFENVILNDHEKVQCLIRKDPRTVLRRKSKERSNSKIVSPIVGNDVHYLTPLMAQPTAVAKRKSDGSQEIPMEKRLENLSLGKLNNKSVPQAENLAHLLVQGLNSKDKYILGNVFHRKDANVVKNTVRRLPLPVIIPLVEELTKMVQGKTLSSQIGALWLHHLIQNHAGLLISNPDVSSLLGPVIGSIESRLALQAPLNRLKGRLNLLLAQVTSSDSQESNSNEEALLVYDDQSSSDLEFETAEYEADIAGNNEWLEENNEEDGDEDESEEEIEMNEISDSDSEMSS